ncbi:ligase-associated DNA damage response endonuclease PdeM [Ostreiculturibacter nitratireducens]|uniref:ligase-associated DNA damage response endonuclease PdeM n=1 Tax=Ostreiculturibacter nitratireducens TaxID=3075226 RepID=UPI0031B5FCF7
MTTSGGVHEFDLAGARLAALASGALWWEGQGLLVVSDLHLGKSERIARGGGTLLPPYEVADTLSRLDDLVSSLSPACVICLGDSFDDIAAAGLPENETLWLTRMMAGRRWIWIEGNHDPGPVGLGGEHRAELAYGPLTFRHIAEPSALGEVSGHYHPKARIAGQSRPCFLVDGARVVMPAFGTYTGGLSCTSPELSELMAPGALAILTGRAAVPVPMPR